MIRVVIADDQGLIRVGLRKVLEIEPDTKVVGEAVDGEQAVQSSWQTSRSAGRMVAGGGSFSASRTSIRGGAMDIDEDQDALSRLLWGVFVGGGDKHGIAPPETDPMSIPTALTG